MKSFLTITFTAMYFCLQAANLSPLANFNVPLAGDTILPKVFTLGEYEKDYEQLNLDHSTMLLSACGDDMDLAFGKWLSMLKEMEAYASLIGYEIKGIKVWLNVFWDEKGEIKHIAYHLKQNSRNVDTQELTAFFSSFMNHYTFPLITDSKYSHYGSASFPTFPKRLKTDAVRGDNAKETNQNLVKDGIPSKGNK